MDILGMKVYLSWYERDDEIFILLNSFLLLVTDTYHLSKVRNHHFAQRNVKSIDGGSCLGIFVGWMFSPLPSITADEPFIHLSVRWPPRQKARSKPTKPHTSDFVGGLILPKWPQFNYLGVNDGGKCHGQFSFFREELAGSIPWGCILGEQWSCSARSKEIERNWPDPMEENRPENWEVSFMPSFFFDEFGLWITAGSNS